MIITEARLKQINLQDEKLKETIRNGKDKFPSLNIHSYNPNKYVYKNSRK